MGMYGGDMMFPLAPPVALLKWGMMVWLITDIDDVPQTITVRVLAPPDKDES